MNYFALHVIVRPLNLFLRENRLVVLGERDERLSVQNFETFLQEICVGLDGLQVAESFEDIVLEECFHRLRGAAGFGPNIFAGAISERIEGRQKLSTFAAMNPVAVLTPASLHQQIVIVLRISLYC